MTIRYVGILGLAAATGYISLSQEIVWMRLFSYSLGGGPTVFANILGVFLIGVALGALTAERLCESRFGAPGSSVVRILGALLMAAAFVFYLGISVSGMAMAVSLRAGLLVMVPAVVVVSFLLGAVFPLLCHYASREGELAGVTVSRIYVANIIGSTLGPLLTGFVFMEHATTNQIILGLSIATLLLGCAVLLLDKRRANVLPLAALMIGLIFMVAGFHPLYRNLLEKLQFTRLYRGDSYSFKLENRSGIVAVSPGENGSPDYIWGGGVYDGRFNTDPINNSNGIRRAYMIAALHPAPATVLEVGLSSASWTRVMANYLPIGRLTVVEINPGYRDVVARYPEQRTVFKEPKVRIVFDDARRWLNRNPDARFDLIVQNTTFHSRSNITNLLSEEYLRLCKRHLNLRGVFYYNATGSEQVPYTAAHIFRHVIQYGTFVAASDEPFDMTPDQIRANLLKFTTDGRPLFGRQEPQMQAVLEELVGADLRDLAPGLRARRDLLEITDDNMATEFKEARWSSPDWSWAAFWKQRGTRRAASP